MPMVWLGNNAPLDAGIAIPGPLITFANVSDDEDQVSQLKTITAQVATGDHMDGVFATHSASAAPAWVESNSNEFALLIASHYGCPVGRPDNWES